MQTDFITRAGLVQIGEATWAQYEYQDLSFDATGGCLSYEALPLGTTSYSVWADAGLLSWYDASRTEGFLGVSTNAPFPSKTVAGKLRWGGGVMIPGGDLFGYMRAPLFSW